MKRVITSLLVTMLVSTVARAAVPYPAALDQMPTDEQMAQFAQSFRDLSAAYKTVKNLAQDTYAREKTLLCIDGNLARAQNLDEQEILRSGKKGHIKLMCQNRQLESYYRRLIKDYIHAYRFLGIACDLNQVSPEAGRHGARTVDFASDVQGVLTGPTNEPISPEEFERFISARQRLKTQVPAFKREARLSANAVVEMDEVIPTLQPDGSLLLQRADGTFTATEPDSDLAALYQKGVDDEAQATEERAAKMALDRLRRAHEARKDYPLERAGASILARYQLPVPPVVETNVDEELLTMRTLSLDEEESIRQAGIEKQRAREGRREERQRRAAAEKQGVTFEIDADAVYTKPAHKQSADLVSEEDFTDKESTDPVSEESDVSSSAENSTEEFSC